MVPSVVIEDNKPKRWGEKEYDRGNQDNGTKVLINPDLMELVEETPDTVIAFTTGRKIIVKESRQDIKNLVKSYRKDIFAD